MSNTLEVIGKAICLLDMITIGLEPNKNELREVLKNLRAAHDELKVEKMTGRFYNFSAIDRSHKTTPI